MKNSDVIWEKLQEAVGDMTDEDGMLKPRYAQEVTDQVIEDSVLLGEVRTSSLSMRKQEISGVVFNTRRHEAWFHITDEFIEDATMQGRLSRVITETAAYAIGLNLESVIFNGNYGLLKQADECHIVDAGSVGLTTVLLGAMARALSSGHKKVDKRFQFLMNEDAELDYREYLKSRQTVCGDVTPIYIERICCGGLPVRPLSFFPEYEGKKGKRTVVLLVDVQNIFVGIWDQIKIELSDHRITVTICFDARFANYSEVAKAINVGLR